MRSLALVVVFHLCLVAAACGGRSSVQTHDREPARVARGENQREPPRLVVSVVLDQVAAWWLDEHWDLLPEDGALKTGAARGAFFHKVRYPYAATLTACGHASIYTGTTPSIHGVVANEVWDSTRHGRFPIVDDGTHAVFGKEGSFAGPNVLRVETVGDALVDSTSGVGKVVSVSLKDRAAVLPGGRRASLALFFNKRNGQFTTSSYYGTELPSWLGAWNQSHPIQQYLTTWIPLDEAVLRAHAGIDDAPGEGNWDGLMTTFPHDLSHLQSYEPFAATPNSALELFDLVRAAVDQTQLGQDDVPDLLAISVSSTDYVGHVFGPGSWEALDDLLRVDKALGDLLRELDTKVDGSLAVLITADHGVAPLVEATRARGGEAYRVTEQQITDQVEHALDSSLSDQHWVEMFGMPYLYLSDTAKTNPARERLTTIAIDALKRLGGIHDVFDVREAIHWSEDPDPLRRAVALSIAEGRGGDLYVVFESGSTLDEEMPPGTGASHGTPWPHDTDVPVIFWGPGVEHSETSDITDQRRVGPTLSALLHTRPPRAALMAPLPGLGTNPLRE